MAKTSGELEQEFIQTAKEKTGKSLEEWLSIVKATGLSKKMEIVNWLKSAHKLNHMQAGFVAGIYLNNGKPVYSDEDNLLEKHFVNCEAMRPLFDAISENILKDFSGTQLIPKKTYLSFTAIREFAAINVRPKEIRLGIDLGDESFTESLQKAKLTGPMARISHMLIFTDIKQFDKLVSGYLKKSYDRTHKK